MWKWVWENIALPTIGAALENVPWWMWAVLAAVLFALAYKAYRVLGWPGLVGAALVVLTFGAYRQGWLNAVKRHDADKFEAPTVQPQGRPTILNFGRKRPKAKRRFNPDTNLWEQIVGTSGN